MWTLNRLIDEVLGPNCAYRDIERLVADAQLVTESLGEDWIKARDDNGRGLVYGVRIASNAALLRALQLVVNGQDILHRVRKRLRGSEAEMRTAFLLAAVRKNARITVEPKINGFSSRPDFRLDEQDAKPIYIEVVCPDESSSYKEASAVLLNITNHLSDVRPGRGIEIYMRRQPTDSEAESIREALLAVGQADADRIEVGSVGFVTLSEPVSIRLYDPDGETISPRIGQMVGDGTRSILARMSFTDERIEKFLRNKAKQLPKDTCNVIVMDIGGTQRNREAWCATIGRLLKHKHTRVSAVLLTQFVPDYSDQITRLEASVVLNSQSRIPAPRWLREFPPIVDVRTIHD